MKYEEFLRMSDIAEKDITYDEYMEVIEPLYMKSSFEKEDFCTFISSIYTAEPTINICRTMNNCFKEPTPKKLKTYRCLADCIETDETFIFYIAAYNSGEVNSLATTRLDKVGKSNFHLLKVEEVLPKKLKAKEVLAERLLEENEKIKEEG